MLRDFLREHRGGEVGTEDFRACAERHLGMSLDWFFDQWFKHGETPIVHWRWTCRREPGGKWLLTVDARQEDTEFTLLVPVFIHFEKDKVVSRPLVMRGRTGQLKVRLPRKPRSVTVNDSWELLARTVHDN